MTQDELQTILDRICKSFIEHDFPTWENIVQLPFTLVLKDGPVTFSDPGTLAGNFHSCADFAKTAGVDQMIRRAIWAQDCGDGTALASFETELLRRGHRMYEPYVSSALFRNIDGDWKLISIMNARNAQDWVEVDPVAERRPA